MTKLPPKFIPIEESAQRVIELVPEVVSYELSAGHLRLNFDKDYPVYGSSTYTRSVTFDIDSAEVPEAVVMDIVLRLRAMLDKNSSSSSPVAFENPKKRKLKKRFWR